jgi:hypothetical protein
MPVTTGKSAIERRSYTGDNISNRIPQTPTAATRMSSFAGKISICRDIRIIMKAKVAGRPTME